MHFENKKQILSKVDALLRTGGRFCLSIDKNQSEYIDMGTRKIRIYPDNPDDFVPMIAETSMHITRRFETEFAHILICEK